MVSTMSTPQLLKALASLVTVSLDTATLSCYLHPLRLVLPFFHRTPTPNRIPTPFPSTLPLSQISLTVSMNYTNLLRSW